MKNEFDAVFGADPSTLNVTTTLSEHLNGNIALPRLLPAPSGNHTYDSGKPLFSTVTNGGVITEYSDAYTSFSLQTSKILNVTHIFVM